MRLINIITRIPLASYLFLQRAALLLFTPFAAAETPTKTERVSVCHFDVGEIEVVVIKDNEEKLSTVELRASGKPPLPLFPEEDRYFWPELHLAPNLENRCEDAAGFDAGDNGQAWFLFGNGYHFVEPKLILVLVDLMSWRILDYTTIGKMIARTVELRQTNQGLAAWLEVLELNPNDLELDPDHEESYNILGIPGWTAFYVEGDEIKRLILDDWSPLRELLKDGIFLEGEHAVPLAEVLSAKPPPTSGPCNRKAACAANDKGLAALQNNDLITAAQHFEAGLRTDARDIELLNNLGYVYLLQGKLEAADRLRAALLIDPKRVNAWINLGQFFASQEGLDDLVAACFTIGLRLSAKPAKTLTFVRQWLENQKNKIDIEALEARLAQDWVQTLVEGYSTETTVSPDDHWRTERDPRNERLRLFNQYTVYHTEVPLFPTDWHITETRWSPDSHQLLVVREIGEDAEQLEPWLAEFKEDNPPVIQRLFVTDGTLFSPNNLPQAKTSEEGVAQQLLFGQWSPNNRYITFWQGIRSASILADGLPLYLLDTHHGDVKEAAETSLCRTSYHSWAADSSALAITAGGNREAWNNKSLIVYNIENGKARTLVANTVQRPGWVAWSPDRVHIAYAAVSAKTVRVQADPYVGGEDHPVLAERRIYLIVPSGGDPRRLNKTEAFHDAPVWQGSRLYYVQRTGNETCLLSADLMHDNAQPVPNARQSGGKLFYGVGSWQDLLAKIPPDIPPTAPHCENPITVAKQLYTQAYRFDIEKPPAKNLLSKRFYAAVRKENDCRHKDGLCALEYEPWLGAHTSTPTRAEVPRIARHFLEKPEVCPEKVLLASSHCRSLLEAAFVAERRRRQDECGPLSADRFHARRA